MRGRAGCVAALAVLALGAAGCGSFEDPDIVIDLRVLAMTATPPSQIVEVDLTQPLDPVALAARIAWTEVCALVADPGLDRRLAWRMTICPHTTDRRCDDGTEVEIGSGVIDDPDITVPEPTLCATVKTEAPLLALLAQALEDDELHGLGGIDYSVQLRVGGEDADRALDQYASKTLRVAPLLPGLLPIGNANPSVMAVATSIDGSYAGALPLQRCVDFPPSVRVRAGVKLRLLPIEPDGVREVYTVPTLDGRVETFTESLTYQWTAGAGGFSQGDTGGPRDLAGNPAPLFTDFRAPSAGDLSGPTDVPIWIVQRDERLGARWYEACVRVMP